MIQQLTEIRNNILSALEQNDNILAKMFVKDLDTLLHDLSNQQEEPKQELGKELFELEQELDIPSSMRWHNSRPKQLENELRARFPANIEGSEEFNEANKQETIEEFIKQSNTPEGLDQFSYDKGLEDGANWQKERMVSKESYEDALSMQKASNAGYESKIKELKQQLKEMYSEEECYRKLHNLMTDIKIFGVVINDDTDLKKWFDKKK